MSHPTITPHLYPFWIKISFLICCILFLICLFDFPYYFKLNKKVQRARQAFDDKNYPDAEIYFKKLLKELPDNKYIKLRLAESLFQSDEIDDHMLALNTLSKIELSKGEWRVLLTYMPSAYVECFQTTKRNRT